MRTSSAMLRVTSVAARMLGSSTTAPTRGIHRMGRRKATRRSARMVPSAAHTPYNTISSTPTEVM